jgi:hypothetical protein
MAEKINLSIDQGTSFSYVKTIYDDVGEPLPNITSYTFLSQLRKTPLSSVATNLTVTPSVPGVLTLSFAPTDTDAIDPGRYCYDVLMVSNTASVTRLFEGIITLNPRITHQANT